LFSLIFFCILVIAYLFHLPLHTNAFVFTKTPQLHDIYLCSILVIISLPVLPKTMGLTSDRLLKILTIFHSRMRSPGNRNCMDILNPYYNIIHPSKPKCSYYSPAPRSHLKKTCYLIDLLGRPLNA
jgi:hypothetical protein